MIRRLNTWKTCEAVKGRVSWKHSRESKNEDIDVTKEENWSTEVTFVA